VLSFLDKLKAKKNKEAAKKEIKCTCGETVETFPGEKKEMYFCRSCNKMLYYVEAELELPKIIPISLGWLKKK